MIHIVSQPPGWETGNASLSLKRQPCVFGTPGSLELICEHKGLCASHSWGGSDVCADVHAGLSWRLMAVEVELTRIHQGDGVEPRLDLRKGEGTQRVGLGRPSRLDLNRSCVG